MFPLFKQQLPFKSLSVCDNITAHYITNSQTIYQYKRKRKRDFLFSLPVPHCCILLSPKNTLVRTG